MIICVVIIVCTVISALAIVTTGALFSAESSATNVISTGSVKLNLIEQSEEDGKVSPFTDVVGVLPGQIVSKIVSVENKGDAAAYVRISVNIEVEFAEGVEATPDASLISLDFNDKNWTLKDGFWYYNDLLEGGQTTSPLFTSVKFADNMPNEYQGSTIRIIVTSQIVQASNNGTNALDAIGWAEAK